jgi:hypothetical protein
MTLKLFMAICIVGLDVLIYFLFQWTLGERNRVSRRRSKAKRRVESGLETELIVFPGRQENGTKKARVLQYRKSDTQERSRPDEGFEPSEPLGEEIAYRRRAAMFAVSK